MVYLTLLIIESLRPGTISSGFSLNRLLVVVLVLGVAFALSLPWYIEGPSRGTGFPGLALVWLGAWLLAAWVWTGSWVLYGALLVASLAALVGAGVLIYRGARRQEDAVPLADEPPVPARKAIRPTPPAQPAGRGHRPTPPASPLLTCRKCAYQAPRPANRKAVRCPRCATTMRLDDPPDAPAPTAPRRWPKDPP